MEKIYQAEMSFEPFVGHIYYLYQKQDNYRLMMIGPDEWDKSKPADLEYLSSVGLMANHT